MIEMNDIRQLDDQIINIKKSVVNRAEQMMIIIDKAIQMFKYIYIYLLCVLFNSDKYSDAKQYLDLLQDIDDCLKDCGVFMERIFNNFNSIFENRNQDQWDKIDIQYDFSGQEVFQKDMGYNKNKDQSLPSQSEEKQKSQLMYYENLERLGDKQIQCKFCNMIFPNMGQGTQHIQKKHQQEELVTCDYCNLKFIFLTDLVVHNFIQHELGQHWNSDSSYIYCQFCDIDPLKKKSLKGHLKMFHQDEVQRMIHRYKAKKNSKMQIQERDILMDLNQFKKDHIIFKEEVSIKQAQLKLPWKINEEVERQKYQANLIQIDDNQYQCKLCSRRILSKSNNYEHWRQYHMKQSFNCNKCNRHFIFLTDLVTHNYILHIQNQKYTPHQQKSKCDFCARLICKQEKSYRNHLACVHTDLVNYLVENYLLNLTPQYEGFEGLKKIKK